MIYKIVICPMCVQKDAVIFHSIHSTRAGEVLLQATSTQTFRDVRHDVYHKKSHESLLLWHCSLPVCHN